MARSTLARHRKTPFLRDPDEGGGGGQQGQGDGASNTDGGAGDGSTGGSTGGTTGKTFTQAEVDEIAGKRAQRERAKFADYDELKAKAGKADELQKQLETDNEKAIREAREEAAAEERKKFAPQAVRAEFRAAAKGVLTDAQRDAFLEDADLVKYLNDKGEVDITKVEAKVKALAPEKDDSTKTSGSTKRVPRDMGQGNRSGGGKASVSSAREDYLEKRRKATQNT